MMTLTLRVVKDLPVHFKPEWSGLQEIQWHAGEPLPEFVKDPQKREWVVSLHADDYELLLLLVCLAEFRPVPVTDTMPDRYIAAETPGRTGEAALEAIQKSLTTLLEQSRQAQEALRWIKKYSRARC